MKRRTFIAAALPLPAFGQQGSITSKTDTGPLVMSTYTATAGAFCSLTHRGVEYIDGKDHGRCLQSAASYDWLGEAFNPTEAGASIFTDGGLPNPSSSQVMNYVADDATLATEVRMAFWNPVAGQRTSNYIHRKWVQAGLPGRPRVVAYAVDFEIPPGAVHSIAQLELLTGYMPPRFNKFLALNLATGGLSDLSDGPGEQPHPIIFSTADGQHAMGILSLTPLVGGGYGRWRHPDCVKWNAVTRVPSPRGTVRSELRIAVGTVGQVQQDLIAISKGVRHG